MRLLVVLIGCTLTFAAAAAETFRVGSYNLRNYSLAPTGNRPAKPEGSRIAVREVIRASRADVIALQEIGSAEALGELQASLRSEGKDFPHHELVRGYDTNIFVAVLSRFPITARRSRTNDSFVLFGRQHPVRRGFAEVEIEVNAHFSFTLLVAHLKSEIDISGNGDPIREQEALLLRRRVEALFAADSNARIIVAGDLNDTPNSPPLRAIIGRKNALLDTRPAEPWPHPDVPDPQAPRIAWTHHYAKEDSHRRIDYLLISRALRPSWRPDQTHVVTTANWGLASDHRMIVMELAAE